MTAVLVRCRITTALDHMLFPVKLAVLYCHQRRRVRRLYALTTVAARGCPDVHLSYPGDLGEGGLGPELLVCGSDGHTYTRTCVSMYIYMYMLLTLPHHETDGSEMVMPD